MREIILIAAIDRNRCIGKDNGIPWNLPGDRKRFATVTEGGTVVMGRKTHESIIAALGRPLPGRRSIVFTRQENISSSFPSVIFVSSWDEMLERAGGAEEIFVIGGGEIYRLALPYAHRAIITHVDAVVAGDTFFPELDTKEWRHIYSDGEGFHKEHPKDEYLYQVSWYERRRKPAAVDMDNARLPEQRAAMERILARGECPFCPEKLATEHKKPILREGAYWLLTENQWPYEHTREHFLFILKKHAEKLSDIPDDAFSELGELARWLENEKEIPGGAVCMRFGDTEFSAGTVRHIHAQFIVPNTKIPGYEPVWFKIGKDKG